MPGSLCASRLNLWMGEMGKKQFKAESKRMLDLMINSIYTHKEIFLREIISNASDAIDKLCYLSLTDDKVGMSRGDFEIILTIDKEGRNLTVSDNGIGMSAEELEHNLGVIAFSGSKAFKEGLEEGKELDTDIIGQFGVGFYSAFMVADKITVISRKYGEEEAHKWESTGADGFTVDVAEREKVGTDVIMHIKPDTEEEPDEFSKYLREYTLYKLVKQYSDYISFPIKLMMPHPEIKEGTGITKEDGTKIEPEYYEVFEYEVLNSMVPLWKKPKSEVTQEEYDEYYKQHYYEQVPPQKTITSSVEGLVSFNAMLFIPGAKPQGYFTDDYKPGITLYSNGVKIMDYCEDLLPDYLNFVRGIVDSPDLSLNISREILQHDRQLKLIGTNLENKIKGQLESMLKDDREGYEKFYQNFGRQLKVCALDNYGAEKDKLQDLLLFYSSTEKKLVTFAEYVERMPAEQKYIYFAPGSSVEGIDKLPQTELLKEHNYEILYFTDNTDEFIADMFVSYKEKLFRNAVDKDLGLEGEEERKDMTSVYKESFDFIKEVLGDRVDEIKASTKLKSHPVSMSNGDGLTFEMEKYFAMVSPEMKARAKRILEINTTHEAFRAFENARFRDKELAKKYAEIFYNQAMLIAGMPVDNPSDYTDLLCSLWK